MMDDGRRGSDDQGDCRMGLTVALIATLALAASAPVPQDAAGWRARSDALYAQGDFRGALEAADRARQLDAVRSLGPLRLGPRPGRRRPRRRAPRDAGHRERRGAQGISRGGAGTLRDGIGLSLPRPRHRAAGGACISAKSPPRPRAIRRRRPGSRYWLSGAAMRGSRSSISMRRARPCGRTRRSRSSSATPAMTSCCTSSRPPATCAMRMPPGARIPCSTSCGRITRRRCRRARISPTCAATCPRGNGPCGTCWTWTRRRPAPRAN